MKKLLLILVATLIVSSGLFAQVDNWCGTPDHESEWLNKYQANPALFPKSDELLYIPLTIHITGSDEGFGYLPIKDVLNAICRLNLDFEGANIQFYVKGEFNYINNTEWHAHEQFWRGVEMMNANNVFGTINCYLVADPAGNCGYYAPSGNAVAMQKGCLGPNDHTWAHEIGHFLSLPHTFRGWEGTDDYNYTQPAPTFVGGRQVEKVDGSNCENAGDRFCDTPADYLSFRWGCNEDGSSQQLQVDPDSVSFRSDGSLFMSYSRDQCGSRFSEEQIAAMRANIMDDRPELLLDDPEIVGPITDYDAQILSPEEGSTIPASEEVILRWESVPNATHYAVLMTNIPVFSGTMDEYIVTDTVLHLTDLEPGRSHFWRLRPYNHFGSFCTEFIDTSSFITGLVSSVSVFERELNFNLFPNPVSGGNNVQFTFVAPKAEQMRIRLINLAGSVLYSEAFSTKVGYQSREVNTANLPKGMYLLGVETATGQFFKKLSVQ